MNKTAIEWCDFTWNPVTGCLHGCEYCYARRLATRFNGGNFKPTFRRDRLEQPIKREKPSRIFVCSMADLFGDWVSCFWIRDVIDVVEQCSQHTFLFLTKNPAMYELVNFRGLKNIWLGVTCVDQEAYTVASSYMPDIQNQGYRTFASVEPIFSVIDLHHWIPDWLIIGAQTGPKAPKIEWSKCLAFETTVFAKAQGIPIFHKDSLGEGFDERELP